MIEKSLCEISNPKQWKTISTDMLKDEGYPVYGANGIIGYYSEYNHEEKTLLITCRGATCGSLNICDPYSYVNGNAMALDNLIEEINIHYLYYYLLNRGLNDAITGTAQPQIVRQSLQKVVIKYPELEVQHQIVNRLNQVANLINKRKKQLEKLDELVKSRFIEMFGEPIANQKNLPIKLLKDISVLITNGNTPKGGSKNYVNSGIIFLRSQNVWRNNIILDDVVYIDENTHAIMRKSSVHNKDILITKTGRINTENSSLGRAALYMGENNSANINGHVYLIRLDDTVIPEYVITILTGEAYRRYIRKVCVGGIDKRQINLDQVEEFPIILPPKEQQEQFANFVKQVDKSKFEIKQSLEKLELLKKALMQKYFG